MKKQTFQSHTNYEKSESGSMLPVVVFFGIMILVAWGLLTIFGNPTH